MSAEELMIAVTVDGGSGTCTALLAGCPLEQFTRPRPVCPVTHNISSETEKSLVSAIVSRHCLLTASP